MQALLLVMSFLFADDALPGEAFARPQAEIVLYAGPSTNHAGVLTLPSDDVVRIGALRGDLVEVFVAQGFPVYLHRDFVTVDRDTARVTVRGENVNMRLLPTVVGLPPVGRASPTDGGLVLLDEERGWVRVLAPVREPLYASRNQLTSLGEAEGRTRWEALFAERERRRTAEVAFRQATDPAFQGRLRSQAEVEAMAQVDTGHLDETALAARVASLRAMRERTTDAALRRTVEGLLTDAEQETSDRERALATVEELKREQARESSRLLREARILDLGLRFLGKGEDRRVEGLVTRRAVEESEAAVFSLRDDTGAVYKLSLAPELGSLAKLTGKRVSLRGRMMPLMNVEGRVLIVDAYDVLPGP